MKIGSLRHCLVSEAHERFISLDEWRDSLLKDLNDLLNTRVLSDGYGLPDISRLGVVTASGRQALCECVIEKIKTFEPRLKNANFFFLESKPGVIVLKLVADVFLQQHRFPLESLLTVAPNQFFVEVDS